MSSTIGIALNTAAMPQVRPPKYRIQSSARRMVLPVDTVEISSKTPLSATMG